MVVLASVIIVGLVVVFVALPAWVDQQGSKTAAPVNPGPGPRSEQTPHPTAGPQTDETARGGVQRTLEAAIEEGRAALAARDPQRAVTAFTRARSLDPENVAAEEGLQSSTALAEIQRLEAEAVGLERRREDRAAVAAARRVLELDRTSSTARGVLDRIARKTAENEYEALVSRGLTALDSGDFAAALDAFSAAAEQRPGAFEVTDGLARAKAGIRRDTITAHVAAAVDAETAEDWPKAIAEYRAALALEPAMAAATTGLARSRERNDLTERVVFHLEHPDRLTTEEVFEEAANLLDEAKTATPRGPRLEELIVRLDRLVALSSRPIPVVLRSDGITDVVLYKVGRLGAFDRHTVELRPGTYTAVGRRPGFRDVRLTIEVDPHSTPPIVVIQCSERI